MPDGPETRLRKRVVKLLDGFPGMYVVKQHGSPFSQAGVPDLLICCWGRFIAIELKVGGNKPTPIQAANIRMIEQAGGIARVCYSVEDVQRVIAEVVNDNR